MGATNSELSVDDQVNKDETCIRAPRLGSELAVTMAFLFRWSRRTELTVKEVQQRVMRCGLAMLLESMGEGV